MALYSHYSEYTGEWLWPNFPIQELSCPHCGEYYHDPESLDMLQQARTIAGKAFNLNSAHRCIYHNFRVGGRRLSKHKELAFDISLANHDRFELLHILRIVGFTTFGYYQTFIHTDIRPNRRWYSGAKARQLWNF